MTQRLQFTPEVQAALQEERYHHPVPLVQRRMEALWLKSHGLPHRQIAKLTGVSENTLRAFYLGFFEFMHNIRRCGRALLGSLLDTLVVAGSMSSKPNMSHPCLPNARIARDGGTRPAVVGAGQDRDGSSAPVSASNRSSRRRSRSMVSFWSL